MGEVGEIRRQLVLASTSPRRRALLREAGFDFSIEPPEIAEVERPDELAETLAERLALEKARAVLPRVSGTSVVLGSDTIVVLGERRLGKPRDPHEAREMLLSLAGRRHRVITGYALVTPEGRALAGVANDCSESGSIPLSGG